MRKSVFDKTIKKEIKRIEKQITSDAKKKLSREEIVIITAFSLIVLFCQVFSASLNIMNWAYVENAKTAFSSYHPWSPIVGTIAYVLYIVCLWYKRIHYWLPYLPAAIGLLYNTLLISMINGYVSPEQLRTIVDHFAFIHALGI